MSGPFGSSQFMYATGAEEGQSLRFEDGDSAYLTWTPASAGNRKTWTFSAWVKRGNITFNQGIFGAESSGDRLVLGFGFGGTDQIRFYSQSPSTEIYTNAVLRDTSAWYHIVWSVDTTQATSTNRIKIYVNGEQITSFASASYPTQNSDYSVNNTVTQYIGRWAGYAGDYFDGYLANVAFIDGQALTPTSFGEYENTLWKPKSDADITSLTMGTNGFYLPFKQTTEAEGFSTVTYTGNGGTQSIEGVGFEPDFVWIKARNFAGHHVLVDSVRGTFSANRYGRLFSNTSGTEDVSSSDTVTSLDADGFGVNSAGSGSYVNDSGDSYVAWCWDAGSGSPVSNTDGSITSTVKANTAKGFSIVSYTGNGITSGESIGHGLSQRPDMVIIKGRDAATSWDVIFPDYMTATQYMALNSTNGITNSANSGWGGSLPDSTKVYVGGSSWTNTSGNNYIAYCFHSVSGYSSIGSYTGDGTSNGSKSINLGFKPAFVMIKRTNATENWMMLDTTRNPSGIINNNLYANLSNAESDYDRIEATATGFDIYSNFNDINASGSTYIYMAFADTRDATFFGDTSGNGNNWTPNALNNTDVVPDSPVSGGNFATFNPLDNIGTSNFSEGNLKVGSTTGSVTQKTRSTFAVSQNFYFEAYRVDGGTQNFNVGVATETANIGSTGNTGVYTKNYSGGAGDVLMFAYSASANALWTGLNGTWDNSATIAEIEAGTTTNATHTSIADEPIAAVFIDQAGSYSGRIIANFGQDSSFAGNETPQGNTDDNGVGDFYYAPPSGFLALTTGNLPTPTITAPDEYFNTVLYTGNGTTQSITGVGFQPDWTWIKGRNIVISHGLFDAVRGAGKGLFSNVNYAEYDYGTTSSGELYQFTSDGFDLGSFGNFNANATTYASWNWLAGGTAVSNTDGSITSQVSANTDAGFSILTYTEPSSGAFSIGHGLGQSPEMIFIKRRDGAESWVVWHKDLATPPTTSAVYLNETYALTNSGSTWLNSVTSSVVEYTPGQFTTGNTAKVMYAFHSVESYSKIGSYTGNGSSDGTYVMCGFRPAWVMFKRTDSTSTWIIQDAERNQYNVVDKWLDASGSTAEGTLGFLDFTANGFKHRYTSGTWNTSGATYIFIAFAEAPFKNANAR